MIKSIAFFLYPVKDIARSRKFYEETLGLKLGMNFQDQWIEYEVDGVAFAISSIDMQHQPGAKGGVVGFEVDDYEKEIARLKAAKVNFLMETYETPVCHFAVITDPDGNEVMIHKRKH